MRAIRRPKRLNGLLIPLWSLLRKDPGLDLGIGNTAALLETAEWIAQSGFNLIQLLPINDTGADNSPYNAISSRAINPLTLDVSPGALRDLPQAAAAAVLQELPRSRLTGFVDYPAVRTLVMRMLSAAYDAFVQQATPERREEFEVFQRATAVWLDHYTLYRALMDFHGTEHWHDWPPGCRRANDALRWVEAAAPAVRERLQRDRAFHAYVQWIAHQQWDAVRNRCDELGVWLMGDIPFGISHSSADVFSEPDLFDLDWFGGAPPEPYFKDDVFTQRWGQNWGIPVYRWDAMRKDGYRWWRRRVEGVTRYFHAFRIDHILGFYRIYRFPWSPSRNAEFTHLSAEEAAAATGGKLPGFFPRDDWAPERAEANRAEGDERLREIVRAASDALIVGEDLGVVPAYVRPHLRSLSILGIKIPMWERTDENRLTPAAEYPDLSFATYGTHDHEPLRTLWTRLLADCRNGEEQNDSRWQLVTLAEFAGLDPACALSGYDATIQDALLAGLFRARSQVVVAMITDFLGTEDRFNVPGSVSSLNWAVRLRAPATQWVVPPILQKTLQEFSTLECGGETD